MDNGELRFRVGAHAALAVTHSHTITGARGDILMLR
jgi:hypothetical protein